jgi:predicted Zn-dependent protease
VASLLDLDEGRSLLEDLVTSEAAYAYLASMFLGTAAERRDDLGLAETRYREAIERLPDGHAAYIALSRVLRLTGRIDAARTLLSASAARPTGTRREPWWWYFYEAPGLAAARVEARRQEARR